MATPVNNNASLSLDDVDFGAQFSHLDEDNDSSDGGEAEDELASLGGPENILEKSEVDLISSFKPNYSEKFLSMGREGNFSLEFSKAEKPASNAPTENAPVTNSLPEEAKYLSYGRAGNTLQDEFSKLQGSFQRTHAVPARTQRRESFKVQLANMDLLQEIGADGSVSEEESVVSSIDRKLRSSSIGKSLASLFGLTELETLIDGDDTSITNTTSDPVFNSKFRPEDMRCLALVAHNHMKPAIKEFVLANKNLLRKFKLTGTNTTMTMLREVFGDDPSVKYGPTCTSGPLGGDAELVAVMCTENLGGCVFFQDPMSAHPHAADIECLARQANVHNVLMMPNPATAYACMEAMRIALRDGRAEMIPSFFRTLESPSVAEYKIRQARVVEKNRGGGK